MTRPSAKRFLEELRSAARAAGLGELLIGGGAGGAEPDPARSLDRATV